MKIFKYELVTMNSQTRLMPLGAMLLTLGIQDGRVFGWFEIDPDAAIESVTIRCYHTGDEIDNADQALYLGTVILDGHPLHYYY